MGWGCSESRAHYNDDDNNENNNNAPLSFTLGPLLLCGTGETLQLTFSSINYEDPIVVELGMLLIKLLFRVHVRHVFKLTVRTPLSLSL